MTCVGARERSWIRCGVAFAGLLAPIAAQETPAAAEKRLRELKITTRDVYSDEDAGRNWFYSLINALHVPTHHEVLRREMWLKPGDPITEENARQYERLLRRLNLFGEVSVTRQPVGEDEVDLLVDTRDRLSIIANGSFSRVGGETRFDAALGEVNLFGTGKSIVADYRKTDVGESAGARYVDPQFGDGRHRFGLAGGSTNEGPFFAVELSRPFRNRADPNSYGGSASFRESEIEFFERGRTVAELPRERTAVRLFRSFAEGDEARRTSYGFDANVGVQHFEEVFGPAASDIRVPGDTTEVSLGAFWQTDRIWEYRKERGIDALDFDEDLPLGIRANARIAAILRMEEDAADELQPFVSVGTRGAFAPFEDTYVTVSGSGSLRWHGDEARGWGASAALHAFNLSLPAQTLAANLSFDAVFEEQGPTAQLTLGEDNGLRGYPAREFAGTRMVRLNLENRFDPGLEVLSVHVGMVGFFDVGWVHSNRTGLSMEDAIRSAGVGLRFGSSNLFGGRVLRLDVAWPLDDVRGEEFSVSLSFASGQVFSFFGNSAVLPSEF